MKKWSKVFQVIGIVIGLLCATAWFSIGNAAEFKITYPNSDSEVKGEVVEIEGEGAFVGANIEVSVLTNEWYVQDGKAEINADGKWTFAPCNLKGKDQYNNHSIKAKLTKDGKVLSTCTVRNIVRK